MKRNRSGDMDLVTARGCSVKRARLLARVSDPEVRYVYIVAQPGSGRSHFLSQLAELFGYGCISLLPKWDELSAAEAAQYDALSESPAQGKLAVAVGTDSSAPHPFRSKSAMQVCLFDDTDLAFTVDEIAEFLRGATVSTSMSLARFAFEQTGGHAGAVAFLRRVLRTEGESAARNLHSNAYSPLRRFVYNRIVATLPVEELAVLMTASAIGDTREEALQEALPACNIAAGLRNLQHRRLLIERDGRLVLTPLLSATLADLCPEDMHSYALSTIESLLEREDYTSAATVALNTGRPADAAEYLARAPGELLQPDAHTIEILQAIPESLLTANPRLWIGSWSFRRLYVDSHVMLAEGQVLLAWCEASEDAQVVKMLRALVAFMLGESGEFEESDAAFGALVEPDGVSTNAADAIVAALWASALTLRCSLTQATNVLKNVPREFAALPKVAAALNAINVRRARMDGNWEAEKTFLLRGIDLAASISATEHAAAMHELANGAMLAGDRTTADHARKTLRSFAERHNVREFAAYSAIADAPFDQDVPRLGTAVWRANMHAMEAFYSGSVDEALLRLTAALENVDVSGALIGRIILRAAIAELVPQKRDALIAEAQLICDRLETSGKLGSSLERLRTGESPAPGEPLHGLVQHYRAMAGEGEADGPLALCITKGTVERKGVAINVSRRVFDVLVALAVKQRPVERDELCEMLWPGQDPQEAANALKMTIRRARIQTGDPNVVAISKNRYVIGEHIGCDFRDMRPICEAAFKDNELLRAKRNELFEFYSGIMNGIPSHLADYEWFTGTNGALQNLAMELGAALARDAIEANDTLWAGELAKMMFDADPCDETAWELRIRALLQTGQRRAAAHAYRKYLATVKEHGVRPTLDAGFKALVAEIA